MLCKKIVKKLLMFSNPFCSTTSSVLFITSWAKAGLILVVLAKLCGPGNPECGTLRFCKGGLRPPEIFLARPLTFLGGHEILNLE